MGQRIILLGVLTAALLSFILFYQVPNDIAVERRYELIKFEADAPIDKIRIRNENGIISLIKKQNIWIAEKNPKTPLNQGSVESLLKMLTSLEWNDRVPPRDVGVDRSKYGLEKPYLEVSIVSQDEERILEFGNKNEYSDLRYVELFGAYDVFLVKDSIAKALSIPLEAFFEQRVFPVFSKSVNSFTVITGDKTFEARRAEDGTWTCDNCGGIRLNDREVTAYLIELTSLVAEELSSKKLPKVLEAPLASIVLKTDKDEVAKAVFLSSQDEIRTYVSLGQPERMVQVPSEVRLLLSDLELKLRERRLFSSGLEKIERVTWLPFGSEVFTISRGEDVWTLDDKSADQAFVRSVLESLSTAEAVGFLGAEHQPSSEAAQTKIIVNTAAQNGSEAAQHTIAIYKGEEDEKHLIASLVGSDELFIISRKTAEDVIPRRETLLASDSIPQPLYNELDEDEDTKKEVETKE